MQQVLWSASGSEAAQKAMWAALDRRAGEDIILATRRGFHGKKGLAGAVTGSEADRERDPRVRFVSFPMKECLDVSLRALQRAATVLQSGNTELIEKIESGAEGGDVTGGREQAILASQDVHDRTCFTR